MAFLPDAELLAIQTEAARVTCDLPCVIQRETRTPRPSGGADTVWNTIATPNAGMSMPTNGQFANYNYMIGSLNAYQLKLPVGTDIRPLDHAIIGGKTLEVKAIEQPRSYQALVTAVCVEVE